ncbi:MAG: glycosyltransferase [Deltaproteobacteria bacterium]|jgi:glycosyltransferase involved in cell wall biosynthesis|nr:glycosyltransferase [Deltaproteobacteria bacterium]
MQSVPLYYWKIPNSSRGNFGDELSPYLVEKITGKIVNFVSHAYSKKLCAIGSIIDSGTLPYGGTFWGSGVQVASVLKRVIDPTTVSFRAVRGPLTRKIVLHDVVGAKVPQIYGDPALLLPKFFTPNLRPKYKFGIILHYQHTPYAARLIRYLRDVLLIEEHELIFIDTHRNRDEVESFVQEIAQCQTIISTSLHGIIVANAYGIPAKYLRVVGIPRELVEQVKFSDYFHSVGLPDQAPLVVDLNQITKTNTNRNGIRKKLNLNFDKTVDLKINLDLLLDVFPFEVIENRFADPQKIKKINSQSLFKTEVGTIANSRLFLANWYLRTYPGVQESGMPPAEHYYYQGWKLGYHPSPYFRGSEYLSRYPDVKNAGLNPLWHYEKFGRGENRVISGLEYPQSSLKLSSLVNNLFGFVYYLRSFRLKSLIRIGKPAVASEIMLIQKSKFFNARWYQRIYLRGAEKQQLSPAEHYAKIGWKLGYNPSPKFSTIWYLLLYPDVAKADLNPLWHYEMHGKQEGRISGLVSKRQISNQPNILDKVVCKFRNKNPKISIIVASYNYERYLEQTLDSLANQTYKNFEVIIVDDGSKDKSVALIKKYLKQYPNFFLYLHPSGKNHGLTKSVQLALSKATGKYVAFCESDDYWTNNHLAEKIKIINSFRNPILIFNNLQAFGEIAERPDMQRHLALIENLYSNPAQAEQGKSATLAATSVKFTKQKIDIAQLRINVISSFSCLMIKRTELLKCNFDSELIPAWVDWWLWRQLLIKFPVFYLAERLTFWRVHSASYNAETHLQERIEKLDDFLRLNNQVILKQQNWLKYFLIKLSFDSIQESEAYQLLSKSKYFNKKWYKETYPEIAKLGLDPVQHYLSLGWRKGYNPSLNFDQSQYVQYYNELDKICPLLHFEQNKAIENRIVFSVVDDFRIFYPPKYKAQTSKTKILLVTHLLNYTGAPIALLNVAKILKDRFEIFVLSPLDGELKKAFLDENIPVILHTHAFTKKDAVQRYKKLGFKFCLCNVYINYLIYKNFRHVIPAIWWIHENIQPQQLPEELEKILRNSKDIYVPSKLTQDYLTKYNPNIKVLCYPVPDVSAEIRTPTQAKIGNGKKIYHFVLLGAISARKGQDIFIEAIKLLPENLRQQAKFEIIGSDKLEASNFSKAIKKASCGIKQIHFLDAIQNQKKYRKLLSQIDVLCCPSREDPLPIVVTEAMMFGKTCIISDRVGQKELIGESELNGFVFPSEDVASLTAILKNIIENKVKLESIGQKSRELFERHFNAEQSLERCLQIIESKIKVQQLPNQVKRKRKR